MLSSLDQNTTPAKPWRQPPPPPLRDAPYTTEDMLRGLELTFKTILETVRRKNGDYASNTAPFANFEACKLLGASVEQGILIRTLDKIVRISNLLSHEPTVIGESMDDSIDDVIAYLGILKEYRKSTQ